MDGLQLNFKTKCLSFTSHPLHQPPHQPAKPLTVSFENMHFILPPRKVLLGVHVNLVWHKPPLKKMVYSPSYQIQGGIDGMICCLD